MRPFAEALERLDSIPGLGQRMAESLVAEIKRKTGRTRKGNVWLRAALIESAHSLGRGRGTYLAAQYRRLTARRGKKKAAVALGHSVLVIVYHLLSHGEVYHDVGVQYFDEG